MAEPHYSLATIRAAFWATFNESGECWFDYFGTSEENSSYTEEVWDGFVEDLVAAQHAHLAPAITAIRTLEDEAGHLHIVLDDGNYEDDDLRFCEGYNAQNLHEMSDEQLALERACIAALWPLTPHERQMANEQAEAEELEAFYQKYPEKRP